MTTRIFGMAAMPVLSNGILLIQCNLPRVLCLILYIDHKIYTSWLRILPFPTMISLLVKSVIQTIIQSMDRYSDHHLENELKNYSTGQALRYCIAR